ncbi:uncharacterized protein LOC143531158 [Bidens hawaiensis]|uniref:uncharacterized protein LOC143531158 n=1 Tax=Bidens hawaiensis TaxID=980011 RepID=UPI004049A19B
MDPNSVLINLQTLTSSKQQRQPYTGDTQLTNSIGQLRSFSTALSAFIRSYNELNAHIGFVNSSIDANFPPNCLVEGNITINPRCLGLLDTSCDRTVQNPRDRVSECELRHAVATDASKKPEVSNSRDIDAFKNRVEMDSLNGGYSHGYDELDALKKPDVCENHVAIDSLKKHEVADNEEIDTRGRDIEVFKNRVEIDSLNSGFDHGYDELDVSKKVEVADNGEEIDTCGRGIGVFKNFEEIDSLKKHEVANNHVEIDTRGRDIDVSENRVEIDSLNSGYSYGYDELDASKKVEVADNDEEIDARGRDIDCLNGGFDHGYDELDASKKPEVADIDEEIDTRGRDVEVFKNHVEIDSLNSGYSLSYDELDASKKVEVADESEEDPEEIEEETVPGSSSDETMAVVREAVVSEENPNVMVANGERSNENVRTPEFLEEINVSVPKKIEEIEILNEPEENGICRNAEETVMVKKLEEFDTLMVPKEIDSSKTRKEIVVLKKLEETVLETSRDQSIALVLERKHKVMAMRTPVSFEEVDVLKKPAVIDIPKKVEVTDICKNSEQYDVLLEPVELDTLMIREEVGTLKKHEELDISMVPEDTDTSKKPEESLPETSCYRTGTTVPEAIVSEQNPNQMATNCEQSHENVSTPENLEEIGICKNPKETVVLEKSETTDSLKKRKKNGTCKNAKKPKASKKSVVSNGTQSHEKVRTPEHLEEIEILNKSEQTDICKNRDESPALKMPEELDIAVISEEINTLKNPEEKLPETSFDRTRTTALEAIKSEQKPNTMAANDKPSHEVVMTPECHEETDASVCKKPEQTVVSKKPEQTDILSKLEETGTCKKSKETKANAKTAVPEAIVSEQNRNRMAADGKPSLETVMAPECQETEVSVPKKPEQTAALKKPQQTVASQKPEETEVSVPKKPEQTVALKKPQQTVASKKPEETGVSVPKKPEQTVALKKPQQTVGSKKPEQTGASKKPEQTVASKKPEQTVASKKPQQTVASKKPEQTVVSKKPEQTGILNKPEQTVVSKQLKKITTLKKHEENGTCKKAKETEAPKKFVICMLESLCRGMCSKDMKWHVASHYSEMINHREEIAKSLKLAKDPAKLVLYSIGRFFIQGSKTFCNPHQKESLGRMASVLILECFVMISPDDGIEIAKREQQYAAEAAVDWKKRMIREGGLRHADEVDARGLLLLISGFGIEDHVFTIQDIVHLIRASNVKGIATALRRSAFLIPKVTEVIYSLVNTNLEIEAVDIAYTFGLEHTCHPGKILTAYLQNKIKDLQNASPLQMEMPRCVAP